MPIALLTLLRLHFRGKLRHSLRGIRTPRGLVFLLLGILVLSLWLGPALYRALRMPHADPQMVRTVAPFAILGFCLSNLFTSFGDAAVPFTGAEVDFLFPGPFTRRSLLGYKILKTGPGHRIHHADLLDPAPAIQHVVDRLLRGHLADGSVHAIVRDGRHHDRPDDRRARLHRTTRRGVLIAAALLAILAIGPTLAGPPTQSAGLHDAGPCHHRRPGAARPVRRFCPHDHRRRADLLKWAIPAHSSSTC
jgi:hypothetical protein